MRIALARNDYAEAINQCKRIIDLDRFNADMIANLGALYAASGDKQQGMRELWRALAIRQNFSSKAVFTATALRYVRVAVTTTLEPGELRNARFLADELQKNAKGDVSLRYLQYALLLANGDERARAEIEAIEKGARDAEATAFADEIAQFLATHPPATP
jgi:tetratricopeptide (TPR) repeat protein